MSLNNIEIAALEHMDTNKDKSLNRDELRKFLANIAKRMEVSFRPVPCSQQNTAQHAARAQYAAEDRAAFTKEQMQYYNGLLKSPEAKKIFSKDFTVISVTEEDVKPIVNVLLQFRSACLPRT